MNVDGLVNIADVATMITELVRTVAGDFNLDGTVDAADYVVWRNSHGATGALYTQGDADLDGDVDGNDLTTWRNKFGFVRAPLTAGSGSLASLQAVPEPASLVLSIMGLTLFLATKTRRTQRKVATALVPNCAVVALCPS